MYLVYVGSVTQIPVALPLWATYTASSAVALDSAPNAISPTLIFVTPGCFGEKEKDMVLSVHVGYHVEVEMGSGMWLQRELAGFGQARIGTVAQGGAGGTMTPEN